MKLLKRVAAARTGWRQLKTRGLWGNEIGDAYHRRTWALIQAKLDSGSLSEDAIIELTGV